MSLVPTSASPCMACILKPVCAQTHESFSRSTGRCERMHMPTRARACPGEQLATHSQGLAAFSKASQVVHFAAGAFEVLVRILGRVCKAPVAAAVARGLVSRSYATLEALEARLLGLRTQFFSLSMHMCSGCAPIHARVQDSTALSGLPYVLAQKQPAYGSRHDAAKHLREARML
jgi:hypothetical protein